MYVCAQLAKDYEGAGKVLRVKTQTGIERDCMQLRRVSVTCLFVSMHVSVHVSVCRHMHTSMCVNELKQLSISDWQFLLCW